MRVCIVYDHIYPATIGGGERWLHDLALRLAAEGHTVTYLTMRHWDTEAPELRGVDVIGLVEAGDVRDDERRTSGAPLRFGLAVGRHLWREGGRYDVVHVAAFPYFPLLAAAAVRRRHRFALVADWFEAWTRGYWIRYAGRVTGSVGWCVQRLCVSLPCPAVCNSQHTARRLRQEGLRSEPLVLPGLYDGAIEAFPSSEVEPLIVAAARHIPEKRLPLLVAGFAEALRSRPDLRLEIYGDGPDRGEVERTVERCGISGAVTVAGRRPQAELEDAMARAACLASASEREGYGLVVVEAAARGTPSVVVAGPENAATDLVKEGVNGAIAMSPSPGEIGRAILRVVGRGAALRLSTVAWFAENVDTLRLDRSLDSVLALYERSLR